MKCKGFFRDSLTQKQTKKQKQKQKTKQKNKNKNKTKTKKRKTNQKSISCDLTPQDCKNPTTISIS